MGKGSGRKGLRGRGEGRRREDSIGRGGWGVGGGDAGRDEEGTRRVFGRGGLLMGEAR